MKYRKKPVEVHAMQYTHENAAHFAEWMGYQPIFVAAGMEIDTLEGTMTASMGDWIIRGIQGEFYPCKADIFAATYEPVEGP